MNIENGIEKVKGFMDISKAKATSNNRIENLLSKWTKERDGLIREMGIRHSMSNFKRAAMAEQSLAKGRCIEELSSLLRGEG